MIKVEQVVQALLVVQGVQALLVVQGVQALLVVQEEQPASTFYLAIMADSCGCKI